MSHESPGHYSDVHDDASGEPVRLIQLTDTHFAADPDADFDGVNTRQSLAAVLQHITRNESRVDAFLATGDLSHDASPESYMTLRDALQTLETPVFCIPGNHDDTETLQRYLTGGWIVCAEAAAFAHWQVLLLNTHVQGWEGGQLGPQRLRSLETMLAGRSERHVLVALHHPPVPIASPWMDAMGLRDGAAFLAVIDKYPQVRAVVWGHIHQEFEQRRHGVWLWGAPSTCVQFKPGATHYERDNSSPGYRRLRLYPAGAVASDVVRLPPAQPGVS